MLGFLFFLPHFSLFGQNRVFFSDPRPGNNLTLKIAVIGPGDELYFWWGHIGLVVEDRVSGEERFYDWGVFSFENENFFVNFAFGRLLYSCMVSRAQANYNVYIRTNRDITLYTLDLPGDKKDMIMRFAENNMLPENRDYMYHHFRDNCATRIRDILDLALDGRFWEKYGRTDGRFTFREHVRRHTWSRPFFDWILNFLMGQIIDRPITAWDEMFLPSEIAERICEFSYLGPDGKERALVSDVEVLSSSAGRPAVLDAPGNLLPGGILASLLFSEILLLLYILKGRREGCRIFLGLVQSLLGLLFGAAGSILFFMTFFTDHDYTFNNSNIFFINPLFLAAIPLGLIFSFSGSEAKRFISIRLSKIFWIYVLLGGLLTLIIRYFPGFYQKDYLTQALVLPVALIMIFILTRLAYSFRGRG